MAGQADREPGTERTDEHGIEQVWVPAGTFLMGTDEASIIPPPWGRTELFSEQPQHQVTLTNGYWIDKYEVSNGAFAAFVDAGGYENQSFWSEAGWTWKTSNRPDNKPLECSETDENFPRACITWFEAEAYATWRGGRLPTEAEWEFAARGPESLIFPYGNEFDRSISNIVDFDSTVAIDHFPEGVSWVGAYNLSGNVMEWVNDWLDRNYYKQDISFINPQGPETGRIKVEKGGWWGSHPFAGRAAYRHFEDPPTYQDHHIGFRIVSDQ